MRIALQNDRRAGTVGFALTILQRRLASSPEAVYQSLRRRRERLEKRLRELELLHRAIAAGLPISTSEHLLDAEDVEDLEDAPENEVEAVEEAVLDQATAASTIAELKAEIAILTRLEALAAEVRRTGQDTKWRELSRLLSELFTPSGRADRVSERKAPHIFGFPGGAHCQKRHCYASLRQWVVMPGSKPLTSMTRSSSSASTLDQPARRESPTRAEFVPEMSATA